MKHSRHMIFWKHYRWTSSKLFLCQTYFQLSSQAPSTLGREIQWKCIKCFLSALRWRNLKKKRNIYRSFRNFCLRKTRLEKWHNYLDAILSERLCFQSISVFRTCTQTDAKPAFCKSSGLKRIFRKLSFHDGRPNRKNKPAFFKFLSEVQTELRFLQMW